MEKNPSPPWIHPALARAERGCAAVVYSSALYGSPHILNSTASSKPHKTSSPSPPKNKDISCFDIMSSLQHLRADHQAVLSLLFH